MPNYKYNYVLLNLQDLMFTPSLLYVLLLDLQIYCAAVMLKTKFSDTRTIPELELLIREEYGIT